MKKARVRALTFFQFNVFLKKGLICLASVQYYNQKSHFLLVGSGTATIYSPLNATFNGSFKNSNKTKKTGTHFDLSQIR